MADVIAKTDMDSAHGRRMLKEIRDMWDEWDLQEDADHTVEKNFKGIPSIPTFQILFTNPYYLNRPLTST